MEIETNRLETRPINKDDKADIMQALNDPEICKYLDYPFPFLEEDWENYITQIEKNLEMPTQTKFAKAIIDKETKQFLGASHFNIFDKGEIGNEKPECIHGEVFLLKEHAGKGYGKEYFNAETKFIMDNEFGENKTKVGQIRAGLFADNIPSIRMQQQSGYVIGTDTIDRFCPATADEYPDGRPYTDSILTRERYQQIMAEQNAEQSR
jgi:RimJ/RimL family protein N-acetyltransferase